MKTIQFLWFAALAFLLANVTPAAEAQPYTIRTLAGLAGNPGAVDDTNAAARFVAPAGCALDSAGNLYIADANAIRRMSPVGTNWVVTTIAGSAIHGTANGTNVDARFDNPQGLAVDAAGNLYVADTFNNALRKVAPVGTNWVATTIAGLAGRLNTSGTNDGANSNARFKQPYGIATDSAGSLYVADTYNHTIRKVIAVGTNWVVSTIAGIPGTNGFANGTGATALFSSPLALAVDTNGVIYVADFGNDAIRRIAPVGTNWVVSTFAGTPKTPGSADGLGGAALLNQPQGIAVDSAQNLYVADAGNHAIRKITPAGLVTTLAGSVNSALSTDGTGSAASFSWPYGIAVDAARRLYIVDAFNPDQIVGDAGFVIRQGQVAPWLRIQQAGNQLVLSWPLGLTGFLPEASSSLSSPAWSWLTNGVAVWGDSCFLTNAPQPGGGFFRLHHAAP